MSDDEVEEAMFAGFQTLNKAQQIRKIMLAGNAEFVIRMLGKPDTATEVGKTSAILLEALTRYLRPQEPKP
jgi:hypothetical protein